MKRLLACSLATLLIAVGFPAVVSASGSAKAFIAASGNSSVAQRRGNRGRVKRQKAPRRNGVRDRGTVGRTRGQKRIRQPQRINVQRKRDIRARNERNRVRQVRPQRAQRSRDQRNWIERARRQTARNDRIRRAQIERSRQIRRDRQRVQRSRRTRQDRDFRYESYRRSRPGRAIVRRDPRIVRRRDDYRPTRRYKERDLRLYELPDVRYVSRYYGHPGRGWGVRSKTRAYRDYNRVRRIARPIVIVDRPYYADYYDRGYDGYYVDPYDRYYSRNDGFVFRIGNRSGDFFLSFGSFDRNPYIHIPYTPYDRYGYATYPYPAYEPAYRGYAAPAYRRSDTFSVNIAGAPISYTRYEEVSYAPAYSDYVYAPVYADRGYSYDPWYEGDRYAIDPYGDVCYPDLGYADNGYYDEPVYYSGGYYSGGYLYDDRRNGRSFYSRHRNVVNIGLATGAGAAIGAILGGKRGAIIGAGVGAGAGAVYTYGIDPKDDRRYGT